MILWLHRKSIEEELTISIPVGSKKIRNDLFLYVRRACRTSEVKVLRGHPLPVNPKATPKPDYREVAGRGRDSEIVALRTET